MATNCGRRTGRGGCSGWGCAAVNAEPGRVGSAALRRRAVPGGRLAVQLRWRRLAGASVRYSKAPRRLQQPASYLTIKKVDAQGL